MQQGRDKKSSRAHLGDRAIDMAAEPPLLDRAVGDNVATERALPMNLRSALARSGKRQRAAECGFWCAAPVMRIVCSCLPLPIIEIT